MKKLLVTFTDRFVSSPYPLLCGWFLFLFSPLLSVIRFYVSRAQTSITAHVRDILSLILVFITYWVVPYCIVMLVLWIRKYSTRKLPKAQFMILGFIVLTTIVDFIGNTFLVHVENSHYPNYVYSHIGITYNSLQVTNKVDIFILVMIAFLIYQKQKGLFFNPKNQKSGKTIVENILSFRKGVVILGLLVAITSAFYPAINALKLYRNTQLTYQDKLGEEYLFVAQLAQHVPAKAQVIHPPQTSNWPFFGNQPMIRYFLYPRVLISGFLISNQTFANSLGSAYFAQIDTNSSLKPWPIIDIQNHAIVFNEKDSVAYKNLTLVSDDNQIKVYLINFL